MESVDLTDLDLDNGEVRYVEAGLQVVAPRARVDFGLAGAFPGMASGTYVGGTATVNVFSGGQRVMPMFAVAACDYGRQTLTDPAGGHVTPVVPTLAHNADTNNTDLATAVLTNSSGTTVTELPRDSTGNIISLTASKWKKTRSIGFFREDSTDPALVVRQDYFWSPSDEDPTAGPLTEGRTSLPRTDLSPDSAPPRTSPTGTPTTPRQRSGR